MKNFSRLVIFGIVAFVMIVPYLALRQSSVFKGWSRINASPTKSIAAAAIDAQGILWWVNHGDCHTLYSIDTQALSQRPDLELQGCVTSVAADRQGNLWLGGAGESYRLDPGGGMTPVSSLAPGVTLGPLGRATQDEQGRFWVEARYDLVLYDGKNWTNMGGGKLPVAAGAGVYYVHEEGVYYTNGQKAWTLPSPLHGLQLEAEYQLNDFIILDLTQGGDSRLWLIASVNAVSSVNSALYERYVVLVYDGQAWQTSMVADRGEALESIVVDGQGQAWTLSAGALYANVEGQWQELYLEQSWFNMPYLYQLDVDQSGRVWLLAKNNHVYVIEPGMVNPLPGAAEEKGLVNTLHAVYAFAPIFLTSLALSLFILRNIPLTPPRLGFLGAWLLCSLYYILGPLAILGQWFLLRRRIKKAAQWSLWTALGWIGVAFWPLALYPLISHLGLMILAYVFILIPGVVIWLAVWDMQAGILAGQGFRAPSRWVWINLCVLILFAIWLTAMSFVGFMAPVALITNLALPNPGQVDIHFNLLTHLLMNAAAGLLPAAMWVRFFYEGDAAL